MARGEADGARHAGQLFVVDFNRLLEFSEVSDGGFDFFAPLRSCPEPKVGSGPIPLKNSACLKG